MSGQEWFRDAFDELYLTVYRHRDGDEARRLMSWLGPLLSVSGRLVLDLACGAARFREPLEALGASYLGLDLSMPLLQRAMTRPGALVRADMRHIPLRPGSLDVVLSMFTSFGYFATDGENRAVLAGVHEVLAPGGRFAIDTLNATRVAETLVPEGERRVGEYQVTETRRIVDGRVVKDITIDRGPTRLRRYRESVRLITKDDLLGWTAAAGLEPLGFWGAYDGSDFDRNGSPRLIAAFQKARGVR